MTKKHQVLRQLDSVTNMAAECINYFVYHPSKDFTRKRKLDAKTFIKTTLAMQGNCLNKELADAFPKPSKRMTASAYEQQKWQSMVVTLLCHMISIHHFYAIFKQEESLWPIIN